MNMLHLPDWTALSEEVSDGVKTITATYDKPPQACLKCGVVAPLLRFGVTRPRVVDIPAYGHRSAIIVVRQRLKCRECGGVFSQPLPDVDERRLMTKRLVAHIEDRCLRDTFARIADDVGVTEGTARLIFREWLARIEDTVKIETPEIMSIDELHLLGKPRCIMTRIGDKPAMIGLLENRNKDTVYRHLLSMENRGRVSVVAMDMWNPYRDAVAAALPKAKIVVDKFHIVRMADEAMERIRKDLRHSASKKKVGRGLMRAHWVLKRRRRDLNETRQLELDAILGTFPTIKTAYELKERFHDIFDNVGINSAEAQSRYALWLADVPIELEPEFRPLITAMANWQTEVFAYFDHRITNAYTEAINGLGKIANRIGRGYSFEVIRAKMLYRLGMHIPARLEQPTEPREANMVRESRTVTWLHISGLRLTEGVSYDSLIQSILKGKDTSNVDAIIIPVNTDQ